MKRFCLCALLAFMLVPALSRAITIEQAYAKLAAIPGMVERTDTTITSEFTITDGKMSAVKFWDEGKYKDAVAEFGRVIAQLPFTQILVCANNQMCALYYYAEPAGTDRNRLLAMLWTSSVGLMVVQTGYVNDATLRLIQDARLTMWGYVGGLDVNANSF
ncbi:MAG: hypothetical protein NC043_05745 [Muribaculaceae bacterium]|nr:hypothetical protein [Muribaculaceae bacterium]